MYVFIVMIWPLGHALVRIKLGYQPLRQIRVHTMDVQRYEKILTFANLEGRNVRNGGKNV